MVAKPDFDKAMAEMHSQLESMAKQQRNIDLRLQQEAERTDRHFTTAEVQSSSSG
jgi:hypothetical protein